MRKGPRTRVLVVAVLGRAMQMKTRSGGASCRRIDLARGTDVCIRRRNSPKGDASFARYQSLSPSRLLIPVVLHYDNLLSDHHLVSTVHARLDASSIYPRHGRYPETLFLFKHWEEIYRARNNTHPTFHLRFKLGLYI